MPSIKEQLYEDFEKTSSRIVPGKRDYQFVEWEDVVDRLNSVFGVRWSSEVRYQEIINSQAVVRIRLEVSDPESERVFWQEGFGGSVIKEKDEPGSWFNAAYAKALRSAAKKWGIGLYLDESGAKHGDHGIPPGAPVKAPTIPFPGPQTQRTDGKAPNIPNAPKVDVQPVPTVPEPELKPEPEPYVPESNLPEPPHTFRPALQRPPVSPPSMPSTPPAPKQMHKPAPAPPMPTHGPTQIQRGQETKPSLPPEPPMSSRDDGTEPLTLVQKAALQSILSISGCSYDQLVREAFEHYGKPVDKIPDVDHLTREEVRGVILYGNGKFRN